MKRILISSLVLLISFLFIPTSNTHAEKITSYKWGKITYKANHIGKIVVKKNTNLYYWDKEYDELIKINTLKQGKEYPIYSSRDSKKHGKLLSIGENKLVKNNSSVTFKKPSKHMKETIGKERVWLRNSSYFIYNSKDKMVEMQNLKEAIILSKKKDDTMPGWYDFKLKIGSKYYTMKDLDKYDEYKYFITTNPFKEYDYNKKTWDLIKAERIQLGMTKNQVSLSWGPPDDINNYESSYGSSSQWIYGNVLKRATYLYFENGKLISRQDF